MDDLVVIILTLVVAVFGIIGQTRKKKLTGEQQQNVKEPASFWDMFENQINPEQQFTGINNFVDEQEPDELIVEDDRIDLAPPPQTYKFDAKNEGKSILKERVVSKVFKPKTTKPKKKKFPLRQAVIYSEILNRKYI